MRVWFRYGIPFCLAAIWFSIFQPWGAFRDPDAFYHAKMAALLWLHGPIKSFPWLDLTTLGTHFADQHLLFHFVTAPFSALFGMLPGVQIASVLFAAALVAFSYFIFRRLSVPWPWFWTAFLAAMPALVFRLSLDKALPFALVFFLMGLAGSALERPGWGFIAGLGFALAHGGWIVLLVCQGLYLFGAWLFDIVVDKKSWIDLFRFRLWRVLAWTVLGVVFGLCVHPNFPQNLWFLWVQVYKIGIATPFGRVSLGAEWNPPTLINLFSDLSFFLLTGLALIGGFLFARRPEFDRTVARRTIGFALPVGLLLSFTIKSGRVVEYLVPMATLWLAVASSLIDPARFLAACKRARMFCVLIIALSLTLFILGDVNTWQNLNGKGVRSYDQFKTTMEAISKEAKPGDRVFNTNWDEFPQLFVLDDRLRYIAGLDPTFLLDENPALSDAYTNLTMGRAPGHLYEVVHDLFHAQFVFIEVRGHASLAEELTNDKRFVLLSDDGLERAYRVQDK